MSRLLAPMVAVLVGCNGPDSREPKRASLEQLSAPAQPQPPSSPPPPSPRIASTSVARFKGDELAVCIKADVNLLDKSDGPGAESFSVQLAALMLADDALVAANGGQAALINKKEQEGITLTMAVLLDGVLVDTRLSEEQKKPFREMVQPLAAGWPPPSFEKEVERGEVLKVTECEFPNRTPLAKCSVAGTTSSKEQSKLERVERLSWSVEQLYYGVDAVDSDGAMKRCLLAEGKWWAASRESRAAAHERIRQHVGQLKAITGRLSAASDE